MVLEKGKVMKSSAFRRFQNAVSALGHDSEEAAQILALEAAESIIDELFGTNHEGYDIEAY